jgi:hypothetical protein
MRHDGDSADGSGKICNTFRSPRFRRQLFCTQNHHIPISLLCTDFNAGNYQDVRVSGSKLDCCSATSYAVVVGYGCNLDEAVRGKLVNEGFGLKEGVGRINRVNVEVSV